MDLVCLNEGRSQKEDTITKTCRSDLLNQKYDSILKSFTVISLVGRN